MKCENCGSSADTEFSMQGQVSWCSPLTGCNIDSVVEDILQAVVVKHKELLADKNRNICAGETNESYDEASDSIIPIHTSYAEVRKWVEEQMKLIVQEMAELEYGF